MNDLSGYTIGELAAFINQALLKEGLKATLSGGACTEIYSNREYVTGDLDFVVNYVWPGNPEIIDRVMSGLGFEKTGRIYINKSVAYSVEFPPGPLGIGEDTLIRPVEMKFKTGSLSLLSPTDSAKDRLAGYLHWNDAQCLEQAVMICRMNKVEMDGIRKWAKREGRPDKFREFIKRLKNQNKKV